MRNRTGKPVRNQDFFGRSAEIAELWHLVERDNVLMLAPRRVGKTSVLFRMRDEPLEGWKCVYLTVEAVDSEARFIARLLKEVYKLKPKGTFWSKLGATIHGVLEHLGSVDAGPVELKLTEAITRDWQEVGDTLLRLLGGIEARTLLLIDEFPIFVRRLLEREDGHERARLLLDWFREVRLDSSVEDAEVHFLLAGSIGLDAVVNRVQMTGTINDLEVFRLGPFSLEQADRFLELLGEAEDMPLTPEVRERLLSHVTWRIPYHLQLMFSEIHRAVRFRGKALDPGLVDEAYESMLDPNKRKHFAHWDERLRDPLLAPGERDLLAALLAAAARDPAGIGLDTARQIRAEVAPTLDEEPLLLGLGHDGYLVEDGSRWRFASSLLKDWWLKWKVRDQ